MTATRITAFPFEFVEYATREFCGRAYVRPRDMHGATDGMYVEIEGIAARHAKIRGVEIDVIGCAVTADGDIVDRERLGMRVRPA